MKKEVWLKLYNVKFNHPQSGRDLYIASAKYKKGHVTFCYTTILECAHNFKSRRLYRCIMNKLATWGYKPEICKFRKRIYAGN